MPPSRRKRDEVLSRRATVAEKYREGVAIAEIAQCVGASCEVIYKDLQSIRADWRRRIAENFDEMQAEELAKLDRKEQQANEAWEQSRCDTVTRKHVEDQDGKPTGEVEVTSKNSCGDPRYLKLALDCVAQRVKILCLDDPEKFAARSNVGKSPAQRRVLEIEISTSEEAAEIRTLSYAEFKQRRGA